MMMNPWSCYEGTPIRRGHVPAKMDLPDGGLKLLDDCTEEDLLRTIENEERAIRWHRARARAIRAYLKYMEDTAAEFAKKLT